MNNNLQKVIVELMKEGYNLEEIISQVDQIYADGLLFIMPAEHIEYHIGDKFFIEPYIHASPQVDEADAYGIYEIIKKIDDDHVLACHQETGEIFATNRETILYLSTGLMYKEIYVGTWRHEDEEYRFINI